LAGLGGRATGMGQAGYDPSLRQYIIRNRNRLLRGPGAARTGTKARQKMKYKREHTNRISMVFF